MTARSFRKRPILLAPFGQHTRYVLRNYLVHAFVVMQALLCIALTIDLLPQVGEVFTGASGLIAWDTAARLLWLTILRSADLLPGFIPLASFLGVLWSEIAHTVSRERVLVWNSGRSPLRCLIPVALLAVVFGTTQFVFDAYLRPAAMDAQIQQQLGSHGRELSRGLSEEAIWIAFGEDVLQARIAYASGPTMYDVTLYRLSADGRVREVDKARSAVPASTPGYWILNDGAYWVIPPEGPLEADQLTATPGSEASATAFKQRAIALAESPLHLSLWGIGPQYLSQAVLRALIKNVTVGDSRSLFVARLQFYYANALMPGAMALLAATLSLMLFAYRAPLYAQLAALPAGYGGHLAMKTFVLLGEHDYMNPVIAAWLTPMGLLFISALLLVGIERRRRKGAKLDWEARHRIARKLKAA